jgi:tRNA-dihydrouridine synthase B
MAHYLATGLRLPPPDAAEVREILLVHLAALHSFYGEHLGVRIARKHLGWYCRELPGGAAFRAAVNVVASAARQLELAGEFLASLRERAELAA